MSNSVMTTVWKQSRQEGTHRLLHVALADGVNDHGFGYHGIEFLAEKCAISDRQTQRLRDDLERDGEIYVQRGSGRGVKTQYLVCTGLDLEEIHWRLEKYFDMEFAEAKNVTLSISEKRVTFSNKRVTSRDKKGDKNRVKGDISKSENEAVYPHGDKPNAETPAATTINPNTEPYNRSMQKVANAPSADNDILGKELDAIPDTKQQAKAKQDKAIANLAQSVSAAPQRKVALKESSPAEDTLFTTDDLIYYAYKHGWGGGETGQAVGVVAAVMKQKVKVALINTRTNAIETKDVTRDSLTLRTTAHSDDPKLVSFIHSPKPEKKPPVDQPVKDAIATYQGVDPKMAGSLTGILSGLATGVWKKALGVTSLTADQYERVARSIPKFCEWYDRNCKDCARPQSRETFENWYSKFVAETVGAGAKVEPTSAERVRIPHPDPIKAALGIGMTVLANSEEAKLAAANGSRTT